jgi:hypothetical protein
VSVSYTSVNVGDNNSGSVVSSGKSPSLRSLNFLNSPFGIDGVVAGWDRFFDLDDDFFTDLGNFWKSSNSLDSLSISTSDVDPAVDPEGLVADSTGVQDVDGILLGGFTEFFQLSHHAGDLGTTGSEPHGVNTVEDSISISVEADDNVGNSPGIEDLLELAIDLVGGCTECKSHQSGNEELTDHVY